MMMGPQDRNGGQALDVSAEMHQDQRFQEEGRLKRTRKAWTAIAHIITAVIGSSVLSLPWATAQLGWIAGPAVLFAFSFVTYCTSLFFARYRKRFKDTPTDTDRDAFGGAHRKIYGLVLHLSLFGVAIGYTITASISMVTISRSNRFQKMGDSGSYHTSSTPYMIAFGIIEIVLSQILDFDQLWWLPIVVAVMSLTYSTIGLGLSVARVAENRKFKGSLSGISIGTVTEAQKIWRSFLALDDMAYVYSYSAILMEIQEKKDTIKSSPLESDIMKNATLISVAVATLVYVLSGCMGYAAFGDMAPENLLTGFGFYNPYWLIDIANAAVVIHLLGAYQIYCQPLFTFIEKHAAQRFSNSWFITKEIEIPIPGFQPYKLNLFRLVWRTILVIITTVISILLPFFSDLVGLFGALGFWPLTVYYQFYPVEVYIAQMKIPKWTIKWVCLRILGVACLIITMVAAAGSVARVVLDLMSHKPFKKMYH